ncbi:MAG: hypothetical protein FWC13_00680 [Oscillospiraceae bacterium]|nr:hypothetical protein [Oscillospiraceae bacterium]
MESLDYSSYEGATIIHDLTKPVPEDLKNRFACVLDGGLLEHVYDYPVALKNAMDMVSIGGHLILCTPGNNHFGHGFYQFSPELFYSVLREENGFSNTKVYCKFRRKWYLIKNPRETHSRSYFPPITDRLLLYVVSKKRTNVPDDVKAYQSDYEELWAAAGDDKAKAISMTKREKLILIKARMPRIFQKIINRVSNKLFSRTKFNKRFVRIRI